MYEGKTLSNKQINDDLLRNLAKSPLVYWAIVGTLGLIVLAATGAVAFMINKGLGVTGLNRPVMWGFFITNFVFWIGISHAGVMLSAILRLSKAEWRRPATRAAEVLTIFSLMTAVLMPLIHSGRPWRLIYWVMFPYDFQRGIWMDIRSPLVWDPAAVNTYLISSVLFVFVALVPDIAIIRDRSSGIKKIVYSILALGWRGTTRQWKFQGIAGILLSALILPVFVSVHSIVSWDFGMAVAVTSWHSTIFAPYFVIGAVHSGVSGVVSVMIFMRWLFGWQNYVRPEHIDALGRLLLVIALAWFYFLLMEFMFGIYGQEGDELATRHMQLLEPPWSWFFVVFIITAFLFPVPMWLFRKVRRNLWLMLITTISVNIGMWLERLLIIVPGLARKQVFSGTWYTYAPSAIEITIIGGTFAMVLMLFLLFAKIFPLIPLFDIKEGQILQDKIKVGKIFVPAVIREE